MADQDKSDYQALLGQATSTFGTLPRSEQEALARFTGMLDHRLGIPHRGTGRGRPGSPQLSREQNLSLEEWMGEGYWAVVVKSSNVTSIRYDKRSLNLYVSFATRTYSGSRLYKYPAIDWQLAEGLFLAPSLGKYVWDRLRRPGIGFQDLSFR